MYEIYVIGPAALNRRVMSLTLIFIKLLKLKLRFSRNINFSFVKMPRDLYIKLFLFCVPSLFTLLLKLQRRLTTVRSDLIVSGYRTLRIPATPGVLQARC